jgi:tetratricopeptide (TPR) repeat protein
MQRSAKLEPGSTYEDYVIGTALGSGGFGTVYRAWGKDGQEVALKISHPVSGRLSTQQVIRQQNEIEALARLSHPSLVKVHRYGFTGDGRFFLAMELVEGVRLDQYLAERRRLDVIEAIQIVRKVAETLAYCHASNVLHLDLKPENIMLTEPHEPRLKVLDFGLAHLRGEAGPGLGAPARGGTLPYMAPEYFQATGPLSPDAKLDLYAIGTILYELLSGELTYDASSVGRLSQFKRYTDPKPIRDRVPSVPDAVAALVHSLLARDPAVRFGSAALLATRLKQLYYSTLAGAPSAGELTPPPAPTGSLTPDGAGPPFVGRREELQGLGEDLAACAAGEGRAALIVGEAGLGKSRLVSEAVRQSAGSETVILYGRCRQLGELVPYSPLREALGQLAHLVLHAPEPRAQRLKEALAGILAGDAVVLGSLVPELYETARPPVPPEHGESDLAAFRLDGGERVGGAIAALFSALGVTVVLVLEDVHWADEGTLAVLSRLLHDGLPARVMVLVTSRPFDELPRGGLLRTIPLAPLAHPENDELLAVLLGEGSDPSLARQLKKSIPLLAAGNPLFNTQVLRNLEFEGYVSRGPDGNAILASRSLSGYEPPDSVSTVLARALRRLDPGSREVLAAGALMGRQFSVTDLRRLGLFPAAQVEAALRESEFHCLCRVSGEVCSFVHDTIREQLQGAIPHQRLPEIHGRIARQLQRRGAPAGTLGRHLEQAGAHRDAAEAYFEAGLAADRMHDPRGARRHLERAFRLLATLETSAERDTALARTTYQLVRVGCALGDTSETLRYLDECGSRLSFRNQETAAALESSYARVAYVRGNLPDAIEHSDRCLATVKDSPALRAYQCFPANVVGRARCISGRFTEASRLLGEGCALAREVGAYGELSQSAGLLAVANAYVGDFAAAQRHADICTEFARRLRDPVRIAAALCYRSAISEACFDWDQGVKETTELLSFSEEHGLGGLYLYVGTIMTGRHQFHVGNLNRARVLLANALNLSSVLKMASVRPWAHTFLGDVHLVAGDREAARTQYLEALALTQSQQGDDFSDPICLVGLAHLETMAGTASPDRVLALGDEAVRRLEAAGNRTSMVTVLQRLAESLEAVGEHQGARRRLADRAALIEGLALSECDFWPRVPASLEVAAAGATPATRREYWRLYSQASHERAVVQRGGDRSTFVSVSTVMAPEKGTGGPGELLERLATIDGFLPPY